MAGKNRIGGKKMAGSGYFSRRDFLGGGGIMECPQIYVYRP